MSTDPRLACVESEHSPVGASSAHRYIECPGSVRLAKRAGKSKASSYAEEGTLAHKVAEVWLRGVMEEWELIGQVPDEMREAVRVYVEHVQYLERNSGSKAQVEVEFHLPTMHPQAFGTADCVVLDAQGGVLHVVDYKHGAGVTVEADENPQLAYYALGALHKMGLEAECVQRVCVWIVQPRAQHDSGPKRFAIYSRDDIASWFRTLKKAMAATDAPNAPLHAGSHCRWCPALAICPEQGKLQISDASRDFATPHQSLPAAELLTTAQLAQVLAQKDVLESWLKAVEERVRVEIEMGHAVPGYKIVAGRGSRSWSDAAQAAQFLQAAVQGRAFSKPELISIAQAEKLKVKVPEHLVRYSPGRPIVAPESDKRTSLSAKSEFSALPTVTIDDF